MKNRFFDFVLLTREEFQKLKDRFGEKNTNELLENLNNYIGSRGLQRKYKSHYHVILTWAKKAGKTKFEHIPEKPVQPRETKLDSPGIKRIRAEIKVETTRIAKNKLWRDPEERALLKKLYKDLGVAVSDARKLRDLMPQELKNEMD